MVSSVPSFAGFWMRGQRSEFRSCYGVEASVSLNTRGRPGRVDETPFFNRIPSETPNGTAEAAAQRDPHSAALMMKPRRSNIRGVGRKGQEICSVDRRVQNLPTRGHLGSIVLIQRANESHITTQWIFAEEKVQQSRGCQSIGRMHRRILFRVDLPWAGCKPRP